MVVNSVSDPAYQALQAMGKPEIPAAFHVLEVCIHVPLCFALIGRYGVLGGAIAWAVRISLNSLLLTVAFARVTKISYRSFLAGALLRPAASAIALLPLVGAAAYWFPGLPRVATILAMAAVGLIYWTGVFALALNREDRRQSRNGADLPLDSLAGADAGRGAAGEDHLTGGQAAYRRRSRDARADGHRFDPTRHRLTRFSRQVRQYGFADQACRSGDRR